MNINSVESYLKLTKPKYLIHLAGLSRIQPSFEHPSLSFEANSLGTQYLMEWVRKKECPLVYAGSSSIHGDKYANPYTFTKYIGEEIIKMYAKMLIKMISSLPFTRSFF